MFRSPFVTSSAVAALISAAATAQFSGAYAPDTWTTTGVGFGGASTVFADDGSQLTVTGGDRAGAQTTTATHAVIADAIWSFDWSYFSVDSNPRFDAGYYLIDGTKFFLASTFIAGGSVSVPVTAGQTIGWQVVSVDGLFGPGILTITNFQIPGPGVLAVFGIAWLSRTRRRNPRSAPA